MHDIWNPWHGCKKISEGCQNCYMYYLDRMREQDGSKIYKVTNNFEYPLNKDRKGNYKIKSGEKIRICMTSDFFIEEADEWRKEIWEIIRQRQDVIFFILTKRPQRVKENLPDWWGEGLENVFFNVTCENQKRADERIPILFSLPFKHKGIMVAPFIGEVHIEKYLEKGIIEQVIAGGENYDGARPLKYEWVESLSNQCKKYDTTFAFIETGNIFVKDKKIYRIKSKNIQSKIAYKLGLSYQGKKKKYILKDALGIELREEDLYVPTFRENCNTCGSKLICNGCSNCGKCEK
jgi:protein gp37